MFAVILDTKTKHAVVHMHIAVSIIFQYFYPGWIGSKESICRPEGKLPQSEVINLGNQHQMTLQFIPDEVNNNTGSRKGFKINFTGMKTLGQCSSNVHALFSFSNGAMDIINIEKLFQIFCRRHSELVSKFKVGLKTLLHQGLLKPEFNGDLVYELK